MGDRRGSRPAPPAAPRSRAHCRARRPGARPVRARALGEELRPEPRRGGVPVQPGRRAPLTRAEGQADPHSPAGVRRRRQPLEPGGRHRRSLLHRARRHRPHRAHRFSRGDERRAGGAQLDVPRRPREAIRRGRRAPRVRRPSCCARPRGAVHRQRLVPVSASVRDGARERRRRRPELRGRFARAASRSLERSAHRRAALAHRSPDPPRGTAGRILLPGAPRGDGALRSGLRDAWRRLPRRAVRPLRARAGLRVERDLVAGGQRRSLRRDPVRRRPALPLPRAVRDDAPFLRGRGESSRRAGPARHVRRDDARSGARVCDGRREARGDLDAALDTRSRDLEHAGALRPEHRARDLRESVPPDDERLRVQPQLVLRGRSRHRVLLERAPAAARALGSTPRCRRRERASTTGAASSRSRATRGRSTRARA